MDEQNNQEEEQLLMDQETGIEKLVDQGTKMAGNAIGQVAKNKGKTASNAFLAFIKAHPMFVLIVIGTILSILLHFVLIGYFIDRFNNLFNGSNSKGITDEKAYITSDANGIILSSDNDIIEIIKEQIKQMGMKSVTQLGLGDEETAVKYLLKYYKATVATQLPYIPGVEDISDKYVQGLVHIKRTQSTVEEARELTWMGYEEFKQKIEAEQADRDLLNYYSIDENWNLCIAIFTETLTDGQTDSYKITESKIPYQTLISQYSVPFRYIITMQQISQNPEYISKLCDMFTEGKQIDFTILDSIETITYTNTYTYSTMSKWVEEVEVETSYMVTNPDGTIYQDTMTEIKEVQKESGPNGPHEEVTVNTTITNTITGAVTYARTWLIELKNNYINESTTTYPLGENGQTTGPESEPEPDGEVASWRVDQYWNVKEQVDKNTWTQDPENEPPELKESEFLGMWRNAKGEYELGADFVSELNGGKLVYYDAPNARQKWPAAGNIVLYKQFLFEKLEDDEITQNYGTIMRYLIYKYDGKDNGVTQLDLSIFEQSDFIQYTPGVVGGIFEEKVWFTLRNAGYSEYAVAGAMGSFYKESGFKSNNLQNSGNKALGMTDEEFTAKVNSGEYSREKFIKDKHGYGLAQWTYYSRKAGLYDYAKQKGVGIDDENMQIEFLLQELSGKYPRWESATSVEEAAKIFCDEFENPDPSVADMPTRIAMAQSYYQKYSGKTMGDFSNGSSVGVRCPRYYQSGQAWSNTPTYRTGKTIASSGCGTCALAMAVSGLTGQNITPDIIEEHLRANKITTYGNGADSAMKIATKYGLTYEYIDRSNKTKIDAALDAGKVLIFSIKANGIYTGDGHFIMCVGRQDNNYYVLESGRYYQTDKPYTFNQVFSRGNQGIFALGRW